MSLGHGSLLLWDFDQGKTPVRGDRILPFLTFGAQYISSHS